LGPFLAKASTDKSQEGGTVNSQVPSNYQLYGVLIHDGIDMNQGHYYSIVKASNSAWYKMNDESVTQSSLQEALRQEAYVLFYSRQSEDTEVNDEKGQLLSKNTKTNTTATTDTTTTTAAPPNDGTDTSLVPSPPLVSSLESNLVSDPGLGVILPPPEISVDSSATGLLVSQKGNAKKRKIDDMRNCSSESPQKKNEN